ncbi:MAG: RagB/SusD family nutrient uptake outer membrane protein [Anditalea sp.]
MKHLNNITLILTLAAFASCKEDLLETIPNDRLSSEIFWRTDQDATFAANAVYGYLGDVRSYFMWDGITDTGHANFPTSEQSLIEKGQIDATLSVIQAQWTNAYTGIRAANTYLGKVDQVETRDQALIDRLKGEVKVIRAYLYIKLAALYGDVPLITTEISLEESRNLSRTPVTEIWDFIAKELADAADVLPNIQSDKGRITKGAALALNARAMLYAGRYQQAADAAKQVMDLNVYSLYPSYEKLFTYEGENNQEVILDKQFIKDNYNNDIFLFMAPWSQLNNSGSTFVPTKKLVDAYLMNNGKDITDITSDFNPQDPYIDRDPRLRYSIFVLGDTLANGNIYDSRPGSGTFDAVDFSWFTTNTGFNVKKYINKEDLADPVNGGINTIILRYADVLLMYAEAKIEVNQIDQSVVDAINKVRERPDVNMPPIVGISSQPELRDIVRHERLVELAFEGQRYFDIRRWKIAEDVMPGNVYGMTYSESGTLKTIEVPAYERTFNKNRDYLWPIPQKERELNPQLKQNPNW